MTLLQTCEKTSSRAGVSKPRFYKIPTVVDVGPGVTRNHGQGRVVQDGECVEDVGAERSVDVLGAEVGGRVTVPSPVGEVTHHDLIALSCNNDEK